MRAKVSSVQSTYVVTVAKEAKVSSSVSDRTLVVERVVWHLGHMTRWTAAKTTSSPGLVLTKCKNRRIKDEQ